MSSPFLTLPRELRDMIIDLVLSSHRRVPRDLYDELTGSRKTYHVANNVSTARVRALAFGQDGPTSNALSLMLTNRQLFIETFEARERLFKVEKVFKMDLMFAQERAIWPTWVYVPAFSKDVDRLEVDLRIVGHVDRFGDGYTSTGLIWRIGDHLGDHLPPAICWPICALLDHLVTSGPQVPTSAAKTWAPTRDLRAHGNLIRHLVFNVSATADEAELARPEDKFAWWGSRLRSSEDCAGQLEDIHRRVMRPEWLARWLLSFLQALLSLDFRLKDYGSVLYQWVGDIDIKVGDVIMEHINLGAKIFALDIADDILEQDRHRWVREWKTNISAWRKQHGLSIGLTDRAAA